jgi:hypothetical protein
VLFCKKVYNNFSNISDLDYFTNADIYCYNSKNDKNCVSCSFTDNIEKVRLKANAETSLGAQEAPKQSNLSIVMLKIAWIKTKWM